MIKKYNTYIRENINPVDPYGEENWDEESAFLNYIRNNYAMDLDKIAYIDCEQKELENLDGIKKLTNLKMLFCNNNNLININEVQFCRELEVLECDGNEIIDLDFIEELRDLVVLRCENNNLQNIDVIKNLKKLKEIVFHTNNFTEEYEKQLKEYCLNNNITYWDNKTNKWIPRNKDPFGENEK